MIAMMRICLTIATMSIMACGSGNQSEEHNSDAAGLNDSPRQEDSILSGVADGRRDSAQATTPADNTSTGDSSGTPLR